MHQLVKDIVEEVLEGEVVMTGLFLATGRAMHAGGGVATVGTRLLIINRVTVVWTVVWYGVGRHGPLCRWVRGTVQRYYLLW